MGKIIRVSGPVVIAEGLEDAKMYDVVRVGQLGLIGEIIRLYRETATIQVYEDTSGIRPGDSVENTGLPLSVQLGPGLLNSIYDGIQRPLDLIRSKAGDFISRGVTANPINEDTYWNFESTVKVGTAVLQGSVLGEVQETSLIKHKVMVPFGISGMVSEIHDGKFRVSDIIARVKTEEGKEVPIRMKQNWPVRMARKVVQKLPPQVPLITGQRVIDTFFPVAKGGTVAVPGPFGSGKCVTGDTKILTGDGSLVEIKELFDRNRNNGTVTKSENEETISLDKELELYSFQDSKIVKSKSKFLYKGKSDTVLKIVTASGRYVRVTPAHKLFKLKNEELVETMAKTLKIGDCIAAVKNIEIGGNTASVMKIDKDLAELIGYFLAKGSVNDNLIKFEKCSGSDTDRITKLVNKLSSSKVIDASSDKVSLYDNGLALFIKKTCYKADKHYKTVPDLVMKANGSVIYPFLKAYLSASMVNESTTEFYTENEELQIQISYTMTRLGMMHNLIKNSRTPGIRMVFEQSSSFLFDAKFEVSIVPESPVSDIGFGTLSLLEESGTAANLGDVYPDPIISIVEEPGPFDVYDVSVPEFGSNFVGGQGALLLHNTVVQHQLSKWADSDVVVYVGCGERGNEMTEILATFPELKDPKSGKPLMERTILIANTSNMPVAAREASIYTGITIAEYYRDMGYNVALMADSTSRWAEALREISGRLEEMPGEEGYPAYLGRRLSEFYERSGNCVVFGDKNRSGSITIVGAVSPPGGDTSEPVSQNTLRVTRVFWALDSSLASRRHFPAINWLNSYSLYQSELMKWYTENAGKDWNKLYSEAMGILQKEAELQEVVQLVGYDALPEKEKAILDIARMIKEDFLQQSAFDEVDTYCSLRKQYLMLSTILEMYKHQNAAIEIGLDMKLLQTLPVRTKISRMKEVKDEDIEKYYNEIKTDIDSQFKNKMEM